MVCRTIVQAAYRSVLVPGGHLRVPEESFGAVSGFLASKLGTVVPVPKRIN